MRSPPLQKFESLKKRWTQTTIGPPSTFKFVFQVHGNSYTDAYPCRCRFYSHHRLPTSFFFQPYLLRNIGETDMFTDFGAVPQTLGAKQYTPDDEEESILNRTITGLLLSGGHAKTEDTSIPVQPQMLQKNVEHSDENMDSASASSIRKEQHQTPSDEPSTAALFAPTEKMYRPAPVNIFRKPRYIIMHVCTRNALLCGGDGDLWFVVCLFVFVMYIKPGWSSFTCHIYSCGV